MLRHYLTFSLTDPMSESSRGATPFTSYFSGTAAAGQINYLERKIVTGTTPVVSINTGTTVQPIWTAKTATTDYVLDTAAGTITWAAYTPASGSDNIKLDCTAIKQWIFDDDPNLDTEFFPRITLYDDETQNKGAGLGTYIDYSSGLGEMLTARFKIVVRHRINTPKEGYVISGERLKNYDIVSAISEQAERFIDEHRVPILWPFWDWRNVGSHRDYSEQVIDGILKCDLLIECKYFNKE